MEDLPLDRIGALVPEFAVKDLPLGRTLMIMILIRNFQRSINGIRRTIRDHFSVQTECRQNY